MLAGRIQDCQCNIIITADEGVRGARIVPLKANTDNALKNCPTIKSLLLKEQVAISIGMKTVMFGIMILYLSNLVFAHLRMNAEDPLFILYIWFHWKAKRCFAYHRWLYGLLFNDS